MPPATAVEAKSEMRAAVAAELARVGKVRVIVGLDLPFTPEGKQTRTAALVQRAKIRTGQDQLLASLQSQNVNVHGRFRFIPYIALEVNSKVLDQLYRSPLVTSVELDSADEPDMSSSNAVIGSPAAWAKGYDGSGYAVAVLDTGVDLTHPWFNTGGSKIVSQACYSSNFDGQSESVCPDGVTESTADGSGDDCGVTNGCDHGTHVAGTVAGNDGAGPNYGVARGADIIAIQIFTKVTDSGLCGSSSTPCTLTFGSDQIKALERVLELSASIDIAAANMSIGGMEYLTETACDAANTAKKAAIDSLRAAGIATVVASGNNGFLNAITQPACISSAISVGATTDADNLASFSNVYSEIDLLAPGTSIVSSVPGGGTGSKQGTSMATPHVAGAWAVLKQFWPEASVTELEDVLESDFAATLVDDNRGGGAVTGMKRINLDLAIEAIEISRQGQLSGSIVDAADDGIPVYPVTIDLVDAVSGALVGKSTTNNPDGSWEMTGITPGDFKLLFIAYGSANGYADELYDGVACDNGSCDMQNLGAIFAVAQGPNTLDVDLTRVFLLSGHITNQNAEPLENMLLEVFDSLGATVGGISSTDASGFWSQPVAVAGSYYARTSGSSPQVLVHEIWNNIPCDGCDPVATGTAIVVTDSDIPGLDFQLALGGGILSGKVVDAADSMTAVHPVAIDLINPVTGAAIDGFTVTNNADGSYELAGIPPGNYKVFFNAFDAAEAWVDELYDNVPCISLGCDAITLGSEINITTGAYALDVDLKRLSLSGTLVDENSQPMPGVAIDILDPGYQLVGGGAEFTDELGQWRKTLPGSGTYFVRTVGESTPQYVPEVWNNIPCDGCDPIATGTPIIVTDTDISGIDFQLALADGRISGVVVSTADGITPVYPVAVDLLDPVTGVDPPGLEATTGTDGRYEITGIPPGEYKIIFNAVNEANNYIDELYDGIPCDNGSCDRAVLGDIINIQPGPNSLDVDLELSAAMGTLSGIVVDAADGTIAVHPVAVDLLDVETGEDLAGLGGTNNADGSYEITDIPPGEYKIIFNAVDSANGYVDELYDGIPCDNGGCDRATLGDIVNITGGLQTLDVDLERTFLLSGTVTNDSNQPLTEILIEVFDEQGNGICCDGSTNGAGEWSLAVPDAGSYYARIGIRDTQGYLPEIWDDIPCDDCDPVATGTAIVVTDSDVGGINFKLSVMAEDNPCRPDNIMVSSFENEQPLLFEDSFEGCRSSLWQELDGDWQVAGGAYFTTTFSNANWLPLEPDDFIAELEMHDIRGGGLWIRLSQNNGVILQIGTADGADFLYWQVLEGETLGAFLNASANGVFTPDSGKHTIKVVVEGASYEAYVDGKLATTLSHEDIIAAGQTPPTAGVVGLQAHNTSTRFDRIRIWGEINSTMQAEFTGDQ